MSTQEWITLSDYSTKYKVSVSTLRRRIKSKTCEYIFEDGKYFLRNKSLKDHRVTDSKKRPAPAVAPPHKTAMPAPTLSLDETSHRLGDPGGEESSPLFATAQKLLNELKKAYSVILQEKEEQILQLKEEVADLKTLARVLEEENDRLKESIVQSQTIDQWLTSIE